MAAAKTAIKYGRRWPVGKDALAAEFEMIRLLSGPNPPKDTGTTLFDHYKAAQTLIWPEDDHHRWSDLMLKEILQNTITAIIGPRDSGKTRCALTKYGLIDYWAFPQETLIIVSSTDTRGLELRVWGDMKDMFTKGKERYPELAGNLVDYMHAICTDNLSEDGVRNMKKGIICIPCLSSSGQFVGIGKFYGLKQKRRRLLGDEVQFMSDTYLDIPANMNRGDFKGVFVGNPLGIGDTLDRIAEPKNGWSSIPEPEKTTTWDNRWMNGRTVNLVGTDSPNFDKPDDPKKYWYMIGPEDVASIAQFYGVNSIQYCSQAKGVRKTGLLDNRVLSREICEKNGAFGPIFWRGTPTEKVYAIDPAYGGDRAIGGSIEFGEEINGKVVINVGQPSVIPIMSNPDLTPDDQIAIYVKNDCGRLGIPSGRVFYDSTGHGSLGNAFARNGFSVDNTIEFGGRPTNRIVNSELMIVDDKDKRKRPKLWNEHCTKFVTELAYAVRYTVESGQMRNLPPEVAKECSDRIWGTSARNMIDVEPKADMKKRTNRSPDLADWLAVAVEGARRLGFKIAKIERPASETRKDDQWKIDLRHKAEGLMNSYRLNFKA